MTQPTTLADAEESIRRGLSDSGTMTPEERRTQRSADAFVPDDQYERMLELRDHGDPTWMAMPLSARVGAATYEQQRDIARGVREHGARGYLATQALGFEVDDDLEFILSLETTDPSRWAQVAEYDRWRAREYGRARQQAAESR